MDRWLVPFQGPADTVGFLLFLLIFPVYHGFYPTLVRLFPNRAARARFDAFRRSWIQGLLERRDLIAAAQQTRNLTMVNSLLGSSALILMGITANLLFRLSSTPADAARLAEWDLQQDALMAKLYLLILIFAVAFSLCMTSLRHLGHFNIVIGADPALIEEHEGSAVDYFSALINRASNRYTLGVRCFYSAFPIFLWMFDSWLFVALTLFWGIKFIGFQDFAHLLRAAPKRTRKPAA